MADTLAAANERLHAGEAVSGPAADRYVAAAREYQARHQGGFLTQRQQRALVSNLRLRIYEHPEALLTCNHDPYKALCDPDHGRGSLHRTPAFNRCDRACANISRTDTHIHRASTEQRLISEELADNLNPLPLARRLSQPNQTLQQIIDEHETTRIHPDEPSRNP
jgi:hypothetical protein